MHDDPTSPLPYLGLAKMALHRQDLNRAAALAQQADEFGASSDGNMIMSLIGVALSVPSLRSRGRDLVLRAADLAPEEWLPQLMAGVILEAVDPDASERYIKRARAMWKGSPARLDDDLQYLRRQLNEHP